MGSPTYGGAKDFGMHWNGVVNIVSTAAMLPAAAFMAQTLYQNPLQVQYLK
jgi:hypothetical protein